MARLAYALLALALLAGATSGWLEYLERDRDFDRAARKYRAARALHRATHESYEALVVALGNCPKETPCRD